jgi:hypothetical protein
MTAENLALARRLWDEGVAASAIGRRLDIGKNAVLSYAHRHGWPPRPSPIGRRKVEVPRAAPKPKPARRETCQPEPLAVPTPVFTRCQWPISSGRPWRFCDKPAERGAWCADHLRAAYVHRSALERAA